MGSIFRFLLKSFSLTNQAIEDLKFGVSYFQHGLLQSNEIFLNKPFEVLIDSNHLQITGNEFRVKILDNQTFNLSSSIDDQNPYNVKKDQLNRNVVNDLLIINSFNTLHFTNLLKTFWSIKK